MRHASGWRWLLPFELCFALLAAGAGSCAAQGATDTVADTGCVFVAWTVDSASGRPLPNVVVTLLGARPGALTDSSGVARVTGLTCEKHEFVARAAGYKSERKTATLRLGVRDTTEFRMQPGRDPRWAALRIGTRGPHGETVADSVAKPSRTIVDSASATPRNPKPHK